MLEYNTNGDIKYIPLDAALINQINQLITLIVM